MILSPELAEKCPKADVPVKLKGSGKQINWATTIRTDMMTKAAGGTLGDGWVDTETMYRCIMACDDASWFIANREKDFFEMNWDWLSLTPEQRAERKGQRHTGPGSQAIGGAGRRASRPFVDGDREDNPTPARNESDRSQGFFLIAAYVYDGRSRHLKNFVSSQDPVTWLLRHLDDPERKPVLMGAWQINSRDYAELLRRL